MKYTKYLLVLCLLLMMRGAWGQDVINPENIPTLNRVADEYDCYKWLFGIASTILAIWSFLGLKFFVKTKAEEWVMAKIAKEADLKVEHVKSAVQEFARIAELKKKKVLVISAAEGQQGNVKQVFDKCGFFYDESSWLHAKDVPTLVLGKVDALLFNDQTNLPLKEEDIEAAMKKFTTNVGYFYLGDKRLQSDAYRQKYNIDLDFCNSTTRLEAGLLSLLKIR
jgi:hypothetical protein